jgi:hypothetical protein
MGCVPCWRHEANHQSFLRHHPHQIGNKPAEAKPPTSNSIYSVALCGFSASSA